MATLYKRATLQQRRILRIIEGAVNNVADAHNQPRNPRFARSIAKRATGTLTSQFQLGAVLTTKTSPSSQTDGRQVCNAHLGMSDHTVHDPREQVTVRDDRRSGRGTSDLRRRSPLLLLRKEISMKMREIKHTQSKAAVGAYVDVLKQIDILVKRHHRKNSIDN